MNRCTICRSSFAICVSRRCRDEWCSAAGWRGRSGGLISRKAVNITARESCSRKAVLGAVPVMVHPSLFHEGSAHPSSVVTWDRRSPAQPLDSTFRPRLRLGDLRQVYADLLVGDAIEQMPDQV
jgi:hypothetical protein